MASFEKSPGPCATCKKVHEYGKWWPRHPFKPMGRVDPTPKLHVAPPAVASFDVSETGLATLEKLIYHANGPWKLVPSDLTITGTIILHDAYEAAIADLITEGSPTPPDELIAIAPEAIAALVAEVRRLRGANRDWTDLGLMVETAALNRRDPADIPGPILQIVQALLERSARDRRG
jgi:hypothetical protein